MIEVTVNRSALKQIETRLGKMKSQAPRALKNAINQTAKDARKNLAKEAQETYTIKNGGFNKAMKLHAASVSNLEATIKAKGEPVPLKNFRVSKAGGQVRAQVLKSGGLKPLDKGGIKAFVNNIAKKGQKRKKKTKKGAKGTEVRHMAVAQRLTEKRLHIKELYSNSVPMMIGNEDRVYGVVEPHIQENLQRNVEEQVRKVLQGR